MQTIASFPRGLRSLRKALLIGSDITASLIPPSSLANRSNHDTVRPRSVHSGWTKKWRQLTCITMRDETEWVELSDSNCNILVGAERKNILKAYHLHAFPKKFPRDFYGSGNASRRIVKLLMDLAPC